MCCTISQMLFLWNEHYVSFFYVFSLVWKKYVHLWIVSRYAILDILLMLCLMADPSSCRNRTNDRADQTHVSMFNLSFSKWKTSHGARGGEWCVCVKTVTSLTSKLFSQVQIEFEIVVSQLDLKGHRSSDKFYNPFMKSPWVTNDNSVHLCKGPASGCILISIAFIYMNFKCFCGVFFGGGGLLFFFFYFFLRCF